MNEYCSFDIVIIIISYMYLFRIIIIIIIFRLPILNSEKYSVNVVVSRQHCFFALIELIYQKLPDISLSSGNYIPMIAVLLVPWAGCDGRLAVALICLAVGATGATFCGFHCAFQVIGECVKLKFMCISLCGFWHYLHTYPYCFIFAFMSVVQFQEELSIGKMKDISIFKYTILEWKNLYK